MAKLWSVPMAKRKPIDPARKSIYNKRNHRKRRLKYVQGYGGKCPCCGEDRFEFLTGHHVNGDGKAERELGGGGSNPIRARIKQGFPPGIAMYCWNCHQAIE